jgi:cell division septation protein DedD
LFFSREIITFAFVIELERHIEILLLSNDCVIVPNFGGFMAHHVDARFDDKEHIFLPPQRTLGFNPQLILNDSLLAQSYIEAYDISYPEAIKRIDDEVREMKQHLENEGTYELYDLGVITLNEEGKYEFEPCEAGILTPELYGLNSFEIDERKKQTVAPIVEIAEKPAENVEEAQESEVKADDNQNISNELFIDEDEDRTINIKISRIRNLAVACIALLLFMFIPSPISNGKGSSITKSKIDTGMLYRLMPKDMVNSHTNSSKIKLIKKAETPKAIAKKDTIAKPKEPFFSVVLCSKVSLKNATAYVNKLHKDGYSEAKVFSKGRHAKVIYGRYATENQAYNIVNKLNNIKDFKGCWVMKIKD